LYYQNTFHLFSSQSPILGIVLKKNHFVKTQEKDLNNIAAFILSCIVFIYERCNYVVSI